MEIIAGEAARFGTRAPSKRDGHSDHDEAVSDQPRSFVWRWLALGKSVAVQRVGHFGAPEKKRARLQALRCPESKQGGYTHTRFGRPKRGLYTVPVAVIASSKIMQCILWVSASLPTSHASRLTINRTAP
jgi:hypothetical protein